MVYFHNKKLYTALLFWSYWPKSVDSPVYVFLSTSLSDKQALTEYNLRFCTIENKIIVSMYKRENYKLDLLMRNQDDSARKTIKALTTMIIVPKHLPLP